MDKKKIAIILILIIIIACIGFVAFNSKQNAKVGSSQVSIPNGYEEIKTTNNAAVLKSNQTTITVEEKKDKTTIDEIFDKYKKEHTNYTVNESSRKIGNITLRSITLINSTDNTTIHTNYYYQKNNKIYHISIKGKTDGKAIDKIVNSTKKQTIPIF